jgi:hypothetical protein
MSERYKILVGQPHNGMITDGAARGALNASKNHEAKILWHGGSLLAAGFNHLYCSALNMFNAGEITHFAMLHADISPCSFWLDILVEEMDRLSADFVSTVVPIKDERGLTSTGVGLFGVDWNPVRRFTMSEIMELPETFSISDTSYPEHVLLHNSGCWLADLRNPLFHAEDADGVGIVSFTIRDRILKKADTWEYQVEPEDWYFSRRLYDQNARTFATRKVSVNHVGHSMYPNDRAWGTQKVDEQIRELWEVVDAT